MLKCPDSQAPGVMFILNIHKMPEGYHGGGGSVKRVYSKLRSLVHVSLEQSITNLWECMVVVSLHSYGLLKSFIPLI